jgi:Rrf2 family transcriptional regulator, cysteine metabolism repressor
MALMSRKVDYAILVLSYLHERAQGGCAREVADHFGLSRPFVANILKELCQNGFVRSHRGVKGGYALARPAGTINLADLMQALEGTFQFAECSQEASGEVCCYEHVCPVKGQIQDVHRRVYEVLRGVTLADLLRPGCGAAGLQVGTDSFRRERHLVGS